MRGEIMNKGMRTGESIMSEMTMGMQTVLNREVFPTTFQNAMLLVWYRN